MIPEATKRSAEPEPELEPEAPAETEQEAILSNAARQELTQKFTRIFGGNEGHARGKLEAADWDLDKAMNTFADEAESSADEKPMNDLMKLQNMGLENPEDVMKAALKQGGSVEAAADLLLEGFTGPASGTDKSTDDLSHSAAHSESHPIAKLMTLVENTDEDLDLDLAQAALDRSNGDVQQAADLLLTGFKKVEASDVQPLLDMGIALELAMIAYDQADGDMEAAAGALLASFRPLLTSVDICWLHLGHC